MPLRPLNYHPAMAAARGYWSWLGQRLWLSQPGRVLFTAAFLAAAVAIAVAHIQGAREGGAPLVVLALLLAGVVALDAVGRTLVGAVRRLV